MRTHTCATHIHTYMYQVLLRLKARQVSGCCSALLLIIQHSAAWREAPALHTKLLLLQPPAFVNAACQAGTAPMSLHTTLPQILPRTAFVGPVQPPVLTSCVCFCRRSQQAAGSTNNNTACRVCGTLLVERDVRSFDAWQTYGRINRTLATG